MANIEYPANCTPITYTTKGNDLAKNLKTLCEKLTSYEVHDDDGEQVRYHPLFHHLTDAKFLQYDNPDVRIYLACCIADLFRIFSPNPPPCESSKLQETLLFIVNNLKGLQDPENTIFRKCFYLLENISSLNTLQLCTELSSEEANVIVRSFIKVCLEVMRSKHWAPQRERSLELGEEVREEEDNEDTLGRKEKMIQIFVQISSKLLSELDHVGNNVLDVLFFYLINPQKSNFRESYNVARTMFQSHSSLESSIEKLLIKSLVVGGLPEECELVGNCTRKLHEVIIELYMVAPELIAPVIPQLSGFLLDDDDQTRLLATKTVSCLLKQPKCDLFDTQPDVWNLYLRRHNDKSREIREEFTKQAGKILLGHSQLGGVLSNALLKALNDSDDDVRLIALTEVIKLAKIKLEAINENLIQACCHRLMDKKPNIRQEALSKLLSLHFKVVCGEEYTQSDKQVVSIIPQKALSVYLKYTMSRTGEYKEEGTNLERYFNAHIIPVKMEMKKRIPFMVEVFYKLRGIAKEAFSQIVARNAAYRRIMRELLDIISNDQSEKDKAKEIENKIGKVSNVQHNKTMFTAAMRQFANILATQPRIFDLVNYSVGLDYTTDELEKKGRELLSLISEQNIPKAHAKSIRYFIERFTCFIMDTFSAVELLRCVVTLHGDWSCGKNEGEEKLQSILNLVFIWAENYPHLFATEDSMVLLDKLLHASHPGTVAMALKVIFVVCSKYGDKVREMSCFNTLEQQAWTLVSNDDPAFHHVSKLACKAMCRLQTKEIMSGPSGRFQSISAMLIDRLDIQNPGCVNALRVLSFLNGNVSKEFFPILKNIAHDVILKIILSNDCEIDDEMELDESKSLKDQKFPRYTLSKIYALKLLCRLLNGDADLDNLTEKTFKILIGCIQSAGMIHNETDKISNIEKALLRAVAGSSMLQLCYRLKYVKMLGFERFSVLANLIADDSPCVRNYFEQRLSKGLRRHRLPVEFFAIYSLVDTLNPEDETIEKFRIMAQSNLGQSLLARMRMMTSSNLAENIAPYYQPEYAIVYSILLLSQSPLLLSFDDVEGLTYLQDCMWFVIERFVVNKSFFNFELIYRSLEKVRQSTNAWAEEKFLKGEMKKDEYLSRNMKLWALTDLAIIMVAYRGKIQTKNEPLKALLPKFNFGLLKKPDNKVYAPLSLIEAEKKKGGRAPVKRKLPHQTKIVPKPTRTNSTRSASNPSPNKKYVDDESSDDDDFEENEENEETFTVVKEDKSALIQPSDRPRRGRPPKSKAIKKEVQQPSPSPGPPRKRGRPKEQATPKLSSLEEIPISPIVKGTIARKNISENSGITSSTPLRVETPKRRSLKKQPPIQEEEPEATTTPKTTPKKKQVSPKKSKVGKSFSPSPIASPPAKRGRGRPKSVLPQEVAQVKSPKKSLVEASAKSPEQSPIVKKRGRPSKLATASTNNKETKKVSKPVKRTR